GITTTCKPLPRVKLAGGSEVTVVWASAPLVETANAANSATKKGAAKRCDNIMTYLARIPKRWTPVFRQEYAQFSRVRAAGTQAFGPKPRHPIPRGSRQTSRS